MTLYNSKRRVHPVTITALIAFVLSLGALITFGNRGACWVWNTFAVPDVELRISKKVDPIVNRFNDELLYNSALHEATMTVRQIEKAEVIYEAKKKGHLAKGD